MIELRHITAGYGGEAVLRDFSVRFSPGKITGILGRNGCGKSTLLKTAAGLLRPMSGEVLVDGRPLGDYAPKELARQIAVLPQSREVPAITVESLVMHGRFPYLGFPRKPRSEDRQAVQRAMEQAGVEALRQKALSVLSGGERQKVYLAMVLAQDTPVILMDEPTTYLDINHQFELLRLIRGLGGQGRTVLCVMHDLGQALEVCDDICLVERGALLAHDTAAAVFDSHAIDRVFGVTSEAVTDSAGQRHYLFREA